MKIAVPHENGEVFQHFGHASEFKIYTDEGKTLTSEIVRPEDVSHEAVAAFLKKQGVDILICGGIGEGARQALEAEHILLCSSVSGKADEVVESFLEGSLEFTSAASCDHHEEAGGCGGSCGSCAGCHGVREPYVETRTFGEIIHLTEENFPREVLNDPGLIIIDFWAEWCEPCKMMAPVFEELSREETKVKFCKLDVDAQPNVAAMFGIDSIPTLVVMQERHALTGMIGVHEKEDIRSMINSCRE